MAWVRIARASRDAARDQRHLAWARIARSHQARQAWHHQHQHHAHRGSLNGSRWRGIALDL